MKGNLLQVMLCPFTGMFQCTGGEAKCDNGICVEQSQLCNGHNDCLDGWDENAANCPKPTSA